jgi:hypothetical protein
VAAGVAVLLVLTALVAEVTLAPLLCGHPSATPPAREVHDTLRMRTSMATGGEGGMVVRLDVTHTLWKPGTAGDRARRPREGRPRRTRATVGRGGAGRAGGRAENRERGPAGCGRVVP